MKDEKFLKEIPDTYWVSEVIEERFDNALSFLTTNSVVYGGAVRDAIAGLPLLGDLDIATTIGNMDVIARNITQNPRWIMKSKKNQKQLAETYGDKVKEEIISGVISFENSKGRILQIVSAGWDERGEMLSELTMARQVDILCCGLVLKSDGRVFEAVPGAYEDCKNRILRPNLDGVILKGFEHLTSRIEKLTKRGWKSEIDLVALKEELERKDEERRKKHKDDMIYCSVEDKHWYMLKYGRSFPLQSLMATGCSVKEALDEMVGFLKKKNIYCTLRLDESEMVLFLKTQSYLESKVAEEFFKQLHVRKAGKKEVKEDSGNTSKPTHNTSYYTGYISTSSTDTSSSSMSIADYLYYDVG